MDAKDNRFLHLLMPRSSLAGFEEYQIDGTAWWTSRGFSTDRLHHHTERDGQGVMLQIAHPGRSFVWEYSREIAKHVYMNTSGTAASIAEACAAALAHQPEIREYAGSTHTTWYRETDKRWVAAIGGEKCEITEHADRWRWWRDYAPASALLALTDGHALAGHSPTLADAMQACIGAPAALLVLCNELVLNHQSGSTPSTRPAHGIAPPPPRAGSH